MKQVKLRTRKDGIPFLVTESKCFGNRLNLSILNYVLVHFFRYNYTIFKLFTRTYFLCSKALFKFYKNFRNTPFKCNILVL